MGKKRSKNQFRRDRLKQQKLGNADKQDDSAPLGSAAETKTPAGQHIAQEEAKTHSNEPTTLQLKDAERSPGPQEVQSPGKNDSSSDKVPEVAPGGRESSSDEESSKAQVLQIFSSLKTIPNEKESVEVADLEAQYANVFEKFGAGSGSGSGHQNSVVSTFSVPYTLSSSEDEEHYTNEEQHQLRRDSNGNRLPLSKRQRRKANKVPISVLKASTNKPSAVEWFDADAPDPFLAVQLKTMLNHVDVPSHWTQKKDYLSSKRGAERSPYVLPKFIENTGIAEMRNHDPESLKKSQRDRVQPKMGKLDIDYQKLHDAFFKHQTKPRMLAFGEVYSEGREKVDIHRHSVASLRPGKISRALRLAVGMSENEAAVPPWVVLMQELGKPPAYRDLIIPGLDVEYTNQGYRRSQSTDNSVNFDMLGATWGNLEDGEESEADSQSESESESEKELENEGGKDEITSDSRVENEDYSKDSGNSEIHADNADDSPEKVEISEYSKIKTKGSSSKTTTTGNLYTVLKEQFSEPGDGVFDGKRHYNMGKSVATNPAENELQNQQDSPQAASKKFKF